MNRDEAPSQQDRKGQETKAGAPDLPALEVLRSRRDFVRLARLRRNCATPGLVLQVAETPDVLASPALIRFGLTASRKVGNAVRRNRARRRLRALARDLLPRLAEGGYDYVLIARHTTPDRPYGALIGDLKTALARLKVTRPAGGKPGEE